MISCVLLIIRNDKCSEIFFMYRRKLPHIPIRQKIFEFFTPKVCWFKKKRYLCIAIKKSCPDGGIGRRAGLKHSCPDGGIGRRAGLKHQWIHFHPGSTPGLGTRKRAKYLKIKYLALFLFILMFPNCSRISRLNMPCSTFIYFPLIQFKYISSYFLHL